MKKNLTLFIVLIFANSIFAQSEPNDCVNAIIVCANGNFVSNANGIGNTQEIAGCSGFEHNSLWIKINIVQSGTLGFDIVPNDTSILVDYDFWVFAANRDCSNLGSPIRCATTNPNLAGLSNNHTGMSGATTLTQTGPGADGNGYVRWITVVAGQSYYIAIDRPVGDGGFELSWTGTATLNSGAFATPPSANTISDYKTCSNTPNVGIFDLNTVRNQINSDLTNNTITFHSKKEDAIDGVLPLSPILANTINPQNIYAKVTNNTTGCNNITDFDLVVFPVPTASISVSKSSICSGESVTVSFSGTPEASIDYTIDNGLIQSALLDSSGKFEITETPTANRIYELLSVKILDSGGNVICSQSTSIRDSKTVTFSVLPTASISGTTTICSGITTMITFNGTPNSIVVYTINGGSNQTVTIDGTGTTMINSPVLTINTVYTLISVTSSVSPFCSRTLTDQFSITVNPLPTASISSITPICIGSTSDITFKGIPNTTVTYSADFGPNATIRLDSSGTALLTTPVLNSDTTYRLISIATTGTLVCTQSLSDSAIVKVNPFPSASISAISPICAGTSTTINFTGTPNSIATYKINAGANQTLSLNALGSASITTPLINATTVYELISVNLLCTQSLNAIATVSVLNLPTVSISGTKTICFGASSIIDFDGTPNATAVYTINNGSNQIVNLNGVGKAQVNTGSLTSNTIYSLKSITSTGTPSCNQTLSGDAIVTIGSSTTITATPETQTICSGEDTNIVLSSNPSSALSWTVIESGVSGAVNGSGNTIVQKLSTTGNAQGTVTYSVALTSGCAGLPKIVTITVNPSPQVNGKIESNICSGQYTDIELLSNSSDISFEWTVESSNITGAKSGFGDINNQFLNTIGAESGIATYKIFPTANGCKGLEINRIVNVNALPKPVINNAVLCVNATTGIPSQNIILDTVLDNTLHNFEWFLNGQRILGATNNRYETDDAGIYEVIAKQTVSGCISLPDKAIIKESFPGLDLITTQSPTFSENATIFAQVIGGNGIYEYQIDDEPFQFSELFTNVAPGPHVITVRDTNGCTNLSKKVVIIGFPKFFTPNGDGINDTWNIVGLEKDSRTKIFIYDRYGKLIYNINTSRTGWDGTYNGQLLPSTDYWFIIEYFESGINKIFKSHFAMKR